MKTRPEIERGEFPFPLTEGAEESPYLTWIRNRANYMAVRGIFDYLRAIGVLVRGILVNFLIFVPALLAISLAVAVSNFLQTPPPFVLTGILLMVMAAWTLLFPLLTPLFRITRYQVSRTTGSDSSVKLRDIYERSFGGFLLAIIVVAALESLPGLLDVFHDRVIESNVGWPTFASAMAAAAAIFSIAPRIMAALGGKFTRILVLLIVAAVGLLVPLLFVLLISDFLVFESLMDVANWLLFAIRAGSVFPLGVIVVLLTGFAFRVFRPKDRASLALLLFGAFVLLGLGFVADRAVAKCCLGLKAGNILNEAIVELTQYPEEIGKLSELGLQQSGPILTELIQELEEFRDKTVQKRDFLQRVPALRKESDRTQLDDFLKDQYRVYRDEQNAYLYLDADADSDTDALRKALTRELLAELRNEAYDVWNLSPLVRLVDAIEPSVDTRSDEDSVAFLSEVHDLYRKVTVLRATLRIASLRELAVQLLAREFRHGMRTEYPLLSTYDEFDAAHDSLALWQQKLAVVREELDTARTVSSSGNYLDLLAELTQKSVPNLSALHEELRRWNEKTHQERLAFSRNASGTDQNPELEAMIGELAYTGFSVRGLRPFVDVSAELRHLAKTRPADLPALMDEVSHLLRRGAMLRELLIAGSPRELVTRLVILSVDDIETILGDAEPLCAEAGDGGKVSVVKKRILSVLSDVGFDSDCDQWPWVEVLPKHYPDYPRLATFSGFAQSDEALSINASYIYLVRDELVRTASISFRNSAFYGAPQAQRVQAIVFWPKFVFIALIAVQLWFLCWLTVDVNLTSIHGLYRDRLASAFLIGQNAKGDIDVEKDIDLAQICNHEAGSTAPYHLINVALNLQGSKDIGIRGRQSDFFIFSKKFIGGNRTGYCRSESMERVFPQMDLATAMAISAAAASPNMGRTTSPALVAFMTLLNIRLGFWIPNPGQVENWLAAMQGKQEGTGTQPGGFSFDAVFRQELDEIYARWQQPAYRWTRQLATEDNGSRKPYPTTEHGLTGIAYSGGGIRSATLNLGITQALHHWGVFDHLDYMSTVSGGGYLGSSISTLMRSRQQGVSEKTTQNSGKKRQDEPQHSVSEIFHWRVRPSALIREILGKLDENSRLVNVSDGGHIENLAGIELLRRRCRYIIIGDGEADPDHHFNGLAMLIQTARIDLGVDIQINADPLRTTPEGHCQAHWTIGRVHYPGERQRGYLLYLKSSIIGDEDEVIKQYRNGNPAFPHESTADQFFGEGQFEAYRSLGQQIGEHVLRQGTGRDGPLVDSADESEQAAMTRNSKNAMSYLDLQHWFEALWQMHSTTDEGTSNPPVKIKPVTHGTPA